MKLSALFALLVAVGAGVLVVSGCGASGPAPITTPPQGPLSPTPPAKWLYVDHLGTFYAYTLPLTSESKPVRTLTEWPGLRLTPVIAVGPYGEVAIASTNTIRIFEPPIVSFEASHVKLSIPLTPAITEVGASGADLVDMQYDPNNNLWLLNDLGGEVSELRAPLSKKMVANVRIGFGAPGSKTAGFSELVQARFDVNATLYVYALGTNHNRLFKDPFPYAKQPSSIGIDLSQPDFVDSSQYLSTSPNPAELLLGQYFGELKTPSPGSPPPPPSSVLGQFDEPFQPSRGLVPNNTVDAVVGALIADPPRERFYTLEALDGGLDVFGLPLRSGAKPIVSLPCLGGASQCAAHEHLFLAP